MEGKDWYQGTADAVRKNLRYLTQADTDYVVILSGDQLYRMDFKAMLKTHIESGAEVTIAAKPVHDREASALGIMQVDDTGRVYGFKEKPQTDEELQEVRMDPAWIDAHGIASDGRSCLASMGIYLFSRKMLIEALENEADHDFGKQVFPSLIDDHRVQVHLFDGYWEDIGTIGSYFEANLQLAQTTAPFALASEDSPIYSRPRFLPSTRVDGATIERSLIADGCIIEPGTRIENSVIGLRCQIGRNVTIRNSIIMGADYYESPENCPADLPPIGIGAGSRVQGAIVDKNCRIGVGAQVINHAQTVDGDVGETCVIRDGILVVEKNASLPDGWRA